MERGELDASRVSERLLDALGAALGVRGAELAEAGVLRMRPAAGAELARAAPTPAAPPMDALDRLFLGGPAA